MCSWSFQPCRTLEPSRDTMNSKHLFAGLALAASAFGPALAQTYPAKTINLFVPCPAGGPSEFFVRKVQPDAAAKLGQTMIIENIGGAGGTIGMAKLVNAPADGYTLFLGSPMELVLAPWPSRASSANPKISNWSRNLPPPTRSWRCAIRSTSRPSRNCWLWPAKAPTSRRATAA